MSEDAHESSPEWTRYTFDIMSGSKVQVDAQVISLLARIMADYELTTDERHAVARWFYERYKGTF